MFQRLALYKSVFNRVVFVELIIVSVLTTTLKRPEHNNQIVIALACLKRNKDDNDIQIAICNVSLSLKYAFRIHPLSSYIKA